MTTYWANWKGLWPDEGGEDVGWNAADEQDYVDRLEISINPLLNPNHLPNHLTTTTTLQSTMTPPAA